MADLGWLHANIRDKDTVLRGVRDGIAYGGPFHVEFHPSDRCNIDCFFCSTAAIRGTDELPIDRFGELLQECSGAGTRSIRFAGGGEPLFHRKIKEMLQAAIVAKLPIENITTNAVLLGEEVAELLVRGCDQVTVSLNTADGESYASMMQTPARNFERVIANVRGLLTTRKNKRASRPRVNLQFLVWKENYKTIPKMYELARELDVDTILFSGLSFLTNDRKMNDEQVMEMLRLYESVIRIDEFRRITNIGSFERDITPAINDIIHRLHHERGSEGLFGRARRFVQRTDEPLSRRIRHHLDMRRRSAENREREGLAEACMIGWYSMLVRSDGTVAPCCILQHRSLGNVLKQPLTAVWHGETYQRFRRELQEIIARREAWRASGDHAVVESVCGLHGSDLCPMKTFYFSSDRGFVRRLKPIFNDLARTYTT